MVTAVRRNDDDRLVAIGYIGKRLHLLVYKQSDAETIRIISLRKAHENEQRTYHENA